MYVSRDLPDLLPELEPPRGGLEKLRGKIASSSRSPSWLRERWAPLGVAAMLAALLIFGFASGRLPVVDSRGPEVAHEVALNFDNPAMVRFGLAEPPQEKVTILASPNAAAALRMKTPDVDFYWIAAYNSGGR